MVYMVSGDSLFNGKVKTYIFSDADVNRTSLIGFDWVGIKGKSIGRAPLTGVGASGATRPAARSDAIRSEPPLAGGGIRFIAGAPLVLG